MSSPFRYFKTSPEIIRLGVMPYVRLPLSLRSIENLLHARGIDVSHEAVRLWWNRIGPIFAAKIRRKRAEHLRTWPQWRGHLDEAFVKIKGQAHDLWRAVDHQGEALEAFVTRRRDKTAALKSLPVAIRDPGLTAVHLRGLRANNRGENARQAVRRRERKMQGFKSPGSARRFLSIQSFVQNTFHV